MQCDGNGNKNRDKKNITDFNGAVISDSRKQRINGFFSANSVASRPNNFHTIQSMNRKFLFIALKPMYKSLEMQTKYNECTRERKRVSGIGSNGSIQSTFNDANKLAFKIFDPNW